MPKNQNSADQVDDLVTEMRIFIRSSLMFRRAIALKLGLNVTDAECIDFLMETGPSAAGDLARVTSLTTGAITNAIDRLEKAGFVKREKDPGDRRKVMVLIVPEKHKKVRKYYESMASDVLSLFSGYSKKELKFLLSHTAAINSIYQKHVKDIVAT